MVEDSAVVDEATEEPSDESATEDFGQPEDSDTLDQEAYDAEVEDLDNTNIEESVTETDYEASLHLEGDAEEESEEEESPEEEPKKSGKGVQKRIDELTRKRKEAEEEAKKWRDSTLELHEENKKLKDVGETAPEEPKPEPKDLKPNEDDFEDYSDYIESLTDWKAREIIKETRTADSEEAKKDSAQKAQQKKAEEFNQRLEEGAKKYDDFDEVVRNEKLAITNSMVYYIGECGDGAADIAYYLGKNPDVALKIAGMPLERQAIKIGEINATVQAPQPKTNKNSKAPPPIKPVGSTGSAQKDPNKMTNKEFREAREQGLI